MPALLLFLKAIPLKDWLYGAAIFGLLLSFGVYTHHERAVGESNLRAAIDQAQRKADAANDKKIQRLTDQHSSDVSEIEDKYENMLHGADTQHSLDLQRLQHYAANQSATRDVLESSTSTGEEADLWRDRYERLGRVSTELADALRRDDAGLKSCYAERDSLTGKP